MRTRNVLFATHGTARDAIHAFASAVSRECRWRRGSGSASRRASVPARSMAALGRFGSSTQLLTIEDLRQCNNDSPASRDNDTRSCRRHIDAKPLRTRQPRQNIGEQRIEELQAYLFQSPRLTLSFQESQDVAWREQNGTASAAALWSLAHPPEWGPSRSG